MNRIQQLVRYFISRGMRLQVNVVIAFFSLIFLISAVIVIYINHKNSNLALQHAETLIANASSRNIDDTVSLLEPVVKSVKILAQLGTIDETLLRQEKIVPYLSDAAVAPLFIERCGIYLKDTPPHGWSGVFEMKSK